ncbi:hypothetical protein [Clostridium beijerinckii]|uniref:hypothetical protein n=1 Tax=Clostridium beijerinckii TaxID=1520 RepID=UPI0017E27618|nr:hypothetical protein [Clostridium beijerinckii]NYC92087.1 hypothetical protein [Clostridium beijerinckii]
MLKFEGDGEGLGRSIDYVKKRLEREVVVERKVDEERIKGGRIELRNRKLSNWEKGCENRERIGKNV